MFELQLLEDWRADHAVLTLPHVVFGLRLGGCLLPEPPTRPRTGAGGQRGNGQQRAVTLMSEEGRCADTVQSTGGFLLAATHPVSTLRALTERLRRTRDATQHTLSLGPSPEAWGRHRRAARALAEAELALRVAEGSA